MNHFSRPRITLHFFSSVLLILIANAVQAQVQALNLKWIPREDLNILLPSSVRIYETNGRLTDGANVRAMYATIDLRDENLKLRAIGSNSRRETTLDTYNRHRAIFAINGGYFSATKSESLLVSDGELVAPGPTNFTRGAFGLVNRKPEIVWPFAIDSIGAIFHYEAPIEPKTNPAHLLKKKISWHPSQAVGAGPVLVKAGKIKDTSLDEGFGASHLIRHPRSAIGYINDHTILVMIVDGRQKSSAGVTIKELAQIMFEAGCHEAVNLDGGGSSAMIAADEIVNVPVDIPNGNRHSLRRNASALILTEEIASVKKKTIYIDTDSENYQEHGIWKSTNHVNYYGESASREAAGSKLNKAVYRFGEIESDSFQLAAWWTIHDKNSSRTNYVLHHGKKVDTIRFDQSSYTANGRWNVLGKYFLSEGDYLEVIGKGGDNKIVTDAIRLVGIGTLNAQPLRGDLRIAVISDLNSGLGSATYEWQVDSIIQRIPRAWRPDLVLCGGDMVAGMGVSDTATLAKMWSGFDEHIALPLRTHQIPFAFTIGNHDGLRSYPTERKAIADYWSDPNHQTGLNFVDRTHFPHYYTFVAGDAFFISWDASSSEITQENLTWVAQQLESNEAKKAKSRFVVGHLPIYSVAQERDSKGNVLENGDALRKMLEKYRVKAYISGHQHAYYPGKRGKLQLLNCGAAGSGPRRWLTTDKQPVNTITIMDVFYQKDTIVYTTYDIKHREVKNMTEFDYHDLPSTIHGVNGHLIRNDIKPVSYVGGVFHPDKQDSWHAQHRNGVQATIQGGKITFEFMLLNTRLQKGENAVTLYAGNYLETGRPIFTIPVKDRRNTQRITMDLDDDTKELLSVAGCYILIHTQNDGDIRAQLFPDTNTGPEQPVITSHNEKNTYGIRDTRALYNFSWKPSRDKDGDFVTYIYQIASDSLFQNVLLTEKAGRATAFKKTEGSLSSAILRNAEDGEIVKSYHRVVATDGWNISISDTTVLQFMKSNEAMNDFIEVEATHYKFDGKIENASGQGSGATWDKAGKLWLADYGGSLHVKDNDGKDAAFSPIQTVTINNRSYSLRPINGIGLDRDGNILLGCNRLLIKIDASTGEGIAVWEAPEGKRAITSPRVNDKGEIYAMSLFAEDPNYVLKQSMNSPGTFDLLRTISLPQRVLARTFDISTDGMTLYFPDPGSAFIQTYTSKDGVTYKRGEDITSIAAGCNAIKIQDEKLFAAVRASGVSGSTLHFRDEKENVMWTLPLNELDGAEARGIAISPDGKTVIICSWDKGGGFFRYENP